MTDPVAEARELLVAAVKRPTLADIPKVAAAHFGLDVSDLYNFEASRTPFRIRARRVAVLVARDYGYTYEAIAPVLRCSVRAAKARVAAATDQDVEDAREVSGVLVG